MKTIELSTCFITKHVDACRSFYERHFAAQAIFDCGWYLNLRIGGNGPSIQFMQPQEGMLECRGKGITLNFKVDDVDALCYHQYPEAVTLPLKKVVYAISNRPQTAILGVD
jgi:hypothetical protein